MLDAVTETFPFPVLLTNIPSPPRLNTAPSADTVRVPAPAFSARIPLADPVTAFDVIVRVDPLAVVFLAKMP